MKKLTKQQIEQIKASRHIGKAIKVLAEEYGVNIYTIHWHTNELYRERLRAYQRKRWGKMTREQKDKYNEGKRSYQKAYQNNRYHNDEVFKLKQIERVRLKSRHQGISEKPLKFLGEIPA